MCLAKLLSNICIAKLHKYICGMPKCVIDYVTRKLHNNLCIKMLIDICNMLRAL